MRKLIILLAVILLIGCNKSPDSERIVYKTEIVYVYDTITTITYVPTPVFDSLAAFKIDSMTQVYYDDIDKKRAHFIAWRDSTENELIEWLGSERERLMITYDSLRKLHIYNNMIIYGDSTSAARAEFDETTGKPILIFE